jgi:hypothetical protein
MKQESLRCQQSAKKIYAWMSRHFCCLLQQKFQGPLFFRIPHPRHDWQPIPFNIIKTHQFDMGMQYVLQIVQTTALHDTNTCSKLQNHVHPRNKKTLSQSNNLSVFLPYTPAYI